MTVTAFGPFAGTQHVDFDALSQAGIFLLHGATGAGKTSVLDAVCYALYGGVPGSRQSRGRAWLRSDHAAPGTATEVVLELTVAGRRLELTRRPEQPRPKRRGSGTTMEKAVTLLREWDPAADRWQARSRSHQEIGEEIGALLGMSREQFCQVVLLPQGDFARFLRAGAEERAALLGRLFDTGRFAALERRLAELRGSAQSAVRAGDEHLLALAHRMREAVHEQQDTGPEDALPAFPESAPGEVGLPEAVLVWAAQVREYAAQRLAVCAEAVGIAGQRYESAQRTHSERARRAEHRRARARLLERAEELRRAEPEREHARQRLGLARAAEQIAPAHALRERAAADHRAALHREAAARSVLPPELAECSAAQLAERRQRTAERFGELLGARRAEERGAQIGRELDRLDAEVRGSEAALADAESWLARWPALREDTQRRLDTAYGAATAAEQLAARQEQVGARLEAARLRDGLGREVESAQERVLTAREEAVGAQERWLDRRERRLRGIAAELAAQLASGEPCTVCGSTDHPRPAVPAAGQVDSAQEEAALAQSRAAEQRREQCERELAEVRRRQERAAADAADGHAGTLAAEFSELTAELGEARRTAGTAPMVREELSRAEGEHERRLAAGRELGGRIASLTAEREALLSEREGLRREVDRLRDGEETVGATARRLEALAERLGEAAEAAKEAAGTAQRGKEADAALADAAWMAGFDSPRSAFEAALDAAGQRELQRALDSWQAEEQALADAFADPEMRAAAQDPHTDPEAELAEAEQLLAAARSGLRAAETAHALARSRCLALDRLGSEATAGARKSAPGRERADLVVGLAGLAAGTSVDNARRMRLESYVLAARLEQVAAAASDRLRRMSDGRFELVHSDERVGRGARSGLGLHVVDSWSGRERDTGTLSGGETFFASLALALGLADVVAQEAGGTRLDTLFIDEGFGSLDEQTLDEVLDVLDTLRERDRSVGIVSHVPDLRMRIPAQLEVLKRRDGSRLRHRGTADG
ncbi:SMC family ATPase [Streptomyces sp. XM4193]|uniref:AAA family ATPase n=1 Tax=Streptomyces sp. XM4193 TaxID=2929782 RepID=UPI001FF80459|nr:SMC family ATPase [Streptomyces sp. XM4193]MCK1798950.1 SMC family ATPase [Streptomyces sp. XM4193]